MVYDYEHFKWPVTLCCMPILNDPLDFGAVSTVSLSRMRCRWLPNGIPKPVLKETSVSKITAPDSPSASPATLSGQVKSLELKVCPDRL